LYGTGKSLPSWVYLNRQAPNVVTLLSLAAAIIAMLQMVHGDVTAAARLLLVCTALDGLDGSLARMMNLSSPFGRQLDSLADLIAFGAAPAILVAGGPGKQTPEIMMVAAAIFAAAGALRLARYNLEGGGSEFSGLPITAAGTALTALCLWPQELPGIAYIAATLGLAWLMVSRVPFAAGDGARQQHWYLYAVWPVGVVLCVVLPQDVLAAITVTVTWGYITLSLARALRHHSEAPRPQTGN
jgi:CDP-diacylglycerol--serine O-phosphatidyltransferase